MKELSELSLVFFGGKDQLLCYYDGARLLLRGLHRAVCNGTAFRTRIR